MDALKQRLKTARHDYFCAYFKPTTLSVNEAELFEMDGQVQIISDVKHLSSLIKQHSKPASKSNLLLCLLANNEMGNSVDKELESVLQEVSRSILLTPIYTFNVDTKAMSFKIFSNYSTSVPTCFKLRNSQNHILWSGFISDLSKSDGNDEHVEPQPLPCQIVVSEIDDSFAKGKRSLLNVESFVLKRSRFMNRSELLRHGSQNALRIEAPIDLTDSDMLVYPIFSKASKNHVNFTLMHHNDNEFRAVYFDDLLNAAEHHVSSLDLNANVDIDRLLNDELLMFMNEKDIEELDNNLPPGGIEEIENIVEESVIKVSSSVKQTPLQAKRKSFTPVRKVIQPIPVPLKPPVQKSKESKTPKQAPRKKPLSNLARVKQELKAKNKPVQS